jgi:hypothetical protein
MARLTDQWIRKIGLVVYSGTTGLDLSEFHIKFNVFNADTESPNNANIRVYNPSPQTVKEIRGQFSKVTLNAGYVGGNYGVIFEGTIKQFKLGKESATTTYLDILASDGDIGYNTGVISKTLAKGTTNKEALTIAAKEMNGAEVLTTSLKTDLQHVPSIRGQVLFGMARASVRNLASTLNASWSINNGNVVITDYQGYLENEVVELTAGTGLIGFPEQTDGGIRLKSLLNPKLRIGGSIQLNNKSINTLIEADPQSAPISYNSYSTYFLAPLSDDGRYRLFVVEHEGDTRGAEWYSNMIALDIDLTVPANKAVIGG